MAYQSGTCPECDTTLMPSSQAGFLTCLNPQCRISIFDPVNFRGGVEMPLDEGGFRISWVAYDRGGDE